MHPEGSAGSMTANVADGAQLMITSASQQATRLLDRASCGRKIVQYPKRMVSMIRHWLLEASVVWLCVRALSMLL